MTVGIHRASAILAAALVLVGTVSSRAGIFRGATGDSAIAKLFDLTTLDARTVFLTVGTLLVFVFSFILFASAVQELAIRAARNARFFYRFEPNVSLSGKPPQSERQALDKMQKWPLIFPTPYLLMSLFAVGVLSIPFYQVGWYLFGAILASLIATVMIRFIRRS